MPTLSDWETKTLKQIVLRYLQGQSLEDTKNSLQKECLEANYSCHDLFRLIPVVKDEDPLLLAILGSLAIKKNAGGAYEKLLANSTNLYELLTHLYHDGHHHVGYLLKLIDKTQPSYLWTLIAGAISSIGLGSWAYNSGAGHAILIWIERSAPPLIHWLSKTVTMLRNIPLLGIIYNSLSLGWIWRSTLAYGTTTNPRKVYYLLFETSAKALTLTAYLLALMAIGHMTIIPACLFIASSCVDVIKSLCSLFINYKLKKTINSSVDKSASWEDQAQQLRESNLIQRSSETVWVKLLAAGMTTITVTFMCIVPPSLFLSASCITIMALVFLAKHSLLAAVHELFAVKLQVSISGLEPPDDPSLNPRVVIEKKGPLFEKEPDLVKIVQATLSNVLTSVVESSPVTLLKGLGGKGPQNEATPSAGITNYPSPLARPPQAQDDQLGGEKRAATNPYSVYD